MNYKKGYKSMKWFFRKEIEIPQEWEIRKLNELYNLEKGKVPSELSDKCDSNFEPYLSTDNLDREKTIFAKKENCVLIKESDVIIIGDGTGSGRTYTGKNGVLSSTCLVFRKQNDQIMNHFLYHILTEKYKLFKNTKYGTSIPHIDKYFVTELPIPLPSLQEQQKIVTVLSNVDSLIESTNKIIKNSKSLKTGLMQEQLTRGIGHTKFKKVPWLFGKNIEIPEKWEIKTLNELSKNGTQNGYAISKNDYGNGFQIVGMTDLFKNDILKENNLKEIKLPKEKIQKFFLDKKDLLFARRSLNIEGAGKCIMVSDLKKETIFESSIIRISINKLHYSSTYVNYFMNSDIGKRAMTRIKQIVAVSGITSSDLKKIKIIIPKKDEQEKIVTVLSNVDSLIESQIKYKEKLEKLKKSLIQKLLTGEVRVKV
jgi:type I restriction enzyme, S subunit